MTQSIQLKEKWMDASQATFREVNNPLTKQREFFIEALIVPFGQVSRNGVLYNTESIKEKFNTLVGKTLNHNHKIEASEGYPKGEWIESWIATEGG